MVTARWVQKQRPGALTVLAVAPSKFERVHIPGAHVFPERFLPDPPTAVAARRDLLAYLRGVGVNEGQRIILYQEDGPPIPVSQAFLVLEAFGLVGRISVLSGGLGAWEKAAGRVSSGIGNSDAPGNLALPESGGVLVNCGFVARHAHQNDTLIVDTRLPIFYSGAAAEPGERPGHIGGAANLPYLRLMGPGGTFANPSEAARLFRMAGLRRGGRLILYCHSGRTASVAYLAAREAGLDARVYAGSWREWQRGCGN